MSLSSILSTVLSHETSKDDLAGLLKTSPEALNAFDKAYREMAINADASVTGNAMDDMQRPKPADSISCDEHLENMIQRIALGLAEKTELITVENNVVIRERYSEKTNEETPETTALRVPVSQEELISAPKTNRPQLTESLMHADLNGPSYPALMEMYQRYLNGKTPEERLRGYQIFHQGLDILDLDPVLYEMLGRNQNSMSHWLPELAAANAGHGFFKIPRTVIAKVPLTLLQMSRLDYSSLTASTKRIVDIWAMRVFGLDTTKDYFIKTGTYSSKFDFRNARVTHGREVEELGEYLLFIQSQASQMAGPLVQPSIYGMSTTNEWVVREFIEDKEENPTIYKGMPLHTEYRVFVDFDSDEILGITPYWRSDVMLKRFSQGAENSPHDYHDYVIYKAHEERLQSRYEANKDAVLEHIREMVPEVGLSGQWSIDVMQNGKDFWLIDMAQAANSALNDVIPKDKLRAPSENWIPELNCTAE